jgi:hypothetical protein
MLQGKSRIFLPLALLDHASPVLCLLFGAVLAASPMPCGAVPVKGFRALASLDGNRHVWRAMKLEGRKRKQSKGSRLLFGESEPRKTSPLPCKQERAASPLAVIAVPGCTALSHISDHHCCANILGGMGVDSPH